MSKTFRVVKIPSENEIVINMGSQDGLTRTSEIEVYKVGVTVIDPETHEDLGTLDTIKAVLKIKSLYDKMAICARYIEQSPLVVFSGLTQTVKRIDRLNVNLDDISGGIIEDDTINVGDFVRKTTS